MQVVNIGTVPAGQRTGVVYCGRPSPLGNPFRLGVHGSRSECIAKFRRWLWERLQARDAVVLAALDSLREDSVLGCWCKPHDCHCDVIVRAWKWLQSQK
jgi:poly(3-hydroxybutyrate) depolymerase